MHKTLERLTEAAFGQRRKMLRSSLKAFPGAAEAAEALGIDLQRRAETLSVDEFREARARAELVLLRTVAAPSPTRRSDRG